MKLKLTAVAVAFAVLAPVANASVQPSFNDNAPITSEIVSKPATQTVNVPHLPQPSFNDNAAVSAQVVTGTRTVQNEFPRHGGSGLGGPTGAATVLAQFERVEPMTQAILVSPSFNG